MDIAKYQQRDRIMLHALEDIAMILAVDFSPIEPPARLMNERLKIEAIVNTALKKLEGRGV